jgi:hypothetical protein
VLKQKMVAWNLEHADFRLPTFCLRRTVGKKGRKWHKRLKRGSGIYYVVRVED